MAAVIVPRAATRVFCHCCIRLSLLPPQFQSFSQYRCKTAKKSEEEIDFLRSNPKIWNVHSVLNVLHSLVDKSNINRQLEVYTSGGECCLPRVPGEQGPHGVRRSHHLPGSGLWFPFGVWRGAVADWLGSGRLAARSSASETCVQALLLSLRGPCGEYALF